MTTTAPTRQPTPARDALLKCRARINHLQTKMDMQLSTESHAKVYAEWERLAFTEVYKLEFASSTEYRQQRAARWLAGA
jgi:hypothetical protein